MALPIVDTQSEDNLGNGMSDPMHPAGTDALATIADQMSGMDACDGELGARAVDVPVWPSPGPMPADGKANPMCTNDAKFVDINGLTCEDYNANFEYCKVAEHYADKDGKTGRHACCSCGGGVQVVPTMVRKCVRPKMGGDEGCTQDEDATLTGTTRGDQMTIKGTVDTIGNNTDSGRSDLDDMIEDQLFDADALDKDLRPDWTVFRDRNFFGQPQDPDSVQTVASDEFVVVGTVRFSLVYSDTWLSYHGSHLQQQIAASAEVDVHSVSIVSVRPGSVIVTFWITPPEDAQTRESAEGIAQRLEQAFEHGAFLAELFVNGFPHCEFDVVDNVSVQQVYVPADFVTGHAHYTTMPYVVGPDETVASVAAKFHVALSLLVAFNEDVADPQLLNEGDILRIPVPRTLSVSDVSPLTTPLQGGLVVTVRGSGFISPTHCRFGEHIVRASVVRDEYVECTTPEQSEPGMYALSVSDGNGEFNQTSYVISYYVTLVPFCDDGVVPPCRPHLTITEVSPKRVAEDTLAILEVKGTGFNSTTVCMVNGEAAPTTVVTRSKLLCKMTGKSAGIYKISLTQQGLTSGNSLEITVFSKLQLTSIFPLNGPEGVATQLTLTGVGFKQGCQCRFNDLLVPATFRTSTQISCSAPASAPKIVSVDVTNDGLVFTPASLYFEYTYLQLRDISTHRGELRGGEAVNVTGYGFYPAMWCKFGDSIVSAQYVSLRNVVCRAPAQTEPKVVGVFVSLDKQHWTRNEVKYEYLPAEEDTPVYVRPTQGQAVGGDDVHVTGGGFDEYCAYTCRFGTKVVPAFYINATQLRCTSPPGAAGTVAFAVESKDRKYRLDANGANMTFTYVGPEAPQFQVYPDHTDVRTANTTVLITGSELTPRTICRFGDRAVMSTFVDSEHINCIAPARDLAQIVGITISQDGGKTWSQVVAYFEYRPVVQRVQPALGHVSGGNTVVVRGYGFNYRVMLCVFGTQAVVANVTDQYTATCVAPAAPVPSSTAEEGTNTDTNTSTTIADDSNTNSSSSSSSSSTSITTTTSSTSTKVRFALTCNSSVLYDPDLHFAFERPDNSREWGVWYVYSADPKFRVDSISPSSGATTGGNTIVVSGEGFDQTTHCVFGNSSVKAVYLDPSTIKCVAPPHVPGEVSFGVIMFNGTQGYNESTLQSTYTYISPELRSLSPESGFVTGGQAVRVYGTRLSGAVLCLFGQYKAKIDLITDTYVECTSPRADIAERVVVSVDFGAASCSGSHRLTFTYLSTVESIAPRSGFVDSDKQVITVSGRGFNGEAVVCAFEFDNDNDKVFVPAVVWSDTKIECNVPSSASPRSVSVRLTDAQHISTVGNKTFAFRYNPVVTEVQPNVGSTSGGTVVVVVGKGLNITTHCVFGSIKVPATVVSDSMVRCTAPNYKPGVVSVVVTAGVEADEQSWFESSPIKFTFMIMNTHVDSLHPTSGPVSGGSLVTIRGSGFSMGSFCRFGDSEVPVIFYAVDHIACYSPPAETQRIVGVEVSQTGGGQGYSTDGATFTYVSSIATVSHIEPSWAPAGELISVFGFNFNKNSSCFFGGRRADTTRVLSSTLIKCRVPEIATRLSEVVEVASDAFALSGGGHVVFHYEHGLGDIDTLSVREIKPDVGPTLGGTLVTVHGVNFPSDAQCRFGDLFVEATVLSPRTLQCVSPQHRAATVTLEVVSRDHSKFSASSNLFTFQGSSGTSEVDLIDSAVSGEPVVEMVSPKTTKLGDTVTLVGVRFSSVGFCVFSGSDGKSSAQVAATVIDSTRAVCKVPQQVKGSVLVTYRSPAGAESKPVALTVVG